MVRSWKNMTFTRVKIEEIQKLNHAQVFTKEAKIESFRISRVLIN